MKTLTTLSLALLAMVLLALAGCESDSGTPDSGDDVVDGGYDVVDSGDKTDDQSGIICSDGKCCQGNICWVDGDIQDEDTQQGDVPVEDIVCEDNDDCPDPYVCYGFNQRCVECEYDDDCPANFRCLDDNTCEALDLLEPFKWLEADWKCTEGDKVGQTFPMKLISWDENDQVVMVEGLPPFAEYSSWSFWYEGETLHGFAKSDDGEYESKDFVYDKENNQISFTSVETVTTDSWNWKYKLIQ
jgi:hypothetical protein